MKAKDIMSKDVVTVKKDATVEEIAHVLTDKNISGVPVVDEENRVIGIVTEKDMLYKNVKPHFPPVVEILGGLIFLKGVKKYNDELKKLVATKAEEIMTKEVFTVDEDYDIDNIATLMVEKDIKRIPVVKDSKLTGIISRADILKYIAKSMD
ncbi:CBS domain-containing protein [Herbivorax sp. ANBcel31]|uniref:CBS domain-containing protein n=1 Tax=Herbivorax sp. ANBcel31 TaxID=3069754 RepID=UPI0027B4F105|nr:CBS domain-containing protein [Herbivorax sp. ANBcel31]MDQ2085615.1 CBS domain-containing protein [Herbivorax sp. ANBcel31]